MLRGLAMQTGRSLLTISVLLLIGCDGEPAQAPEAPGKLEQAVETTVPEAAQMRPPSARGLNLPPVPALSMPPATVKLDRCPNDKPKRPDWADLVAAKEALKAQLPAELPATPAPQPAPSPEHLARQEAFLQTAAGEMDRINALPPEERERAYTELKSSMLGE